MSTAVPTVTGLAQDVADAHRQHVARVVGQRLDITTTYQWYRCDAAERRTASRSLAATGSTYLLARADLGNTIAVIVSAASGLSAFRAERALRRPTAPIGPRPSTTSPAVPAGATKDGATLNAPDNHLGELRPRDADVAVVPVHVGLVVLAPISGATSDTYVLQATDVGMKLKAAIIGNVGRTGASPPVTTGLTAAVQPLNNGAPSITPNGTVADGQSFNAGLGSWDGATNPGLHLPVEPRAIRPAASPRAHRSASRPGRRTPPGPADVGMTLRLVVSASKNSSACSTASDASTQTAVIAPLSTGLPTLSGPTQDTGTITATSLDSTWDGVSGIGKTYQFSRCDTGGTTCSQMQTGTKATYALTYADIGSTIRVTVIGSANGSIGVPSGASVKTAVVTPLSTGAPAAPTGQTQDKSVLTASTGAWVDADKLAYTYQWFQCNPGCTTSLGAPSSSPTYTPAGRVTSDRRSASSSPGSSEPGPRRRRARRPSRSRRSTPATRPSRPRSRLGWPGLQRLGRCLGQRDRPRLHLPVAAM